MAKRDAARPRRRPGGIYCRRTVLAKTRFIGRSFSAPDRGVSALARMAASTPRANAPLGEVEIYFLELKALFKQSMSAADSNGFLSRHIAPLAVTLDSNA